MYEVFNGTDTPDAKPCCISAPGRGSEKRSCEKDKLIWLKNTFFSFAYCITLYKAYSQEREKEAHYNYFSFGTCVYTNATGTFNQKMFITTEFGRTFGIFDIGLMVGRLNLAKGGDSIYFTEILPTINVFSKGKFSEALTLGAGYVFGAKQKLSYRNYK